MLKGILIKGAPSLGTKFNPNFRDPHHAPQGNRPKSRGLTQGNIIQIASKALAVISSQGTSPNNRRNFEGIVGLKQHDRSQNNRTTDLGNQHNSIESSIDPDNSMLMQGV